MKKILTILLTLLSTTCMGMHSDKSFKEESDRIERVVVPTPARAASAAVGAAATETTALLTAPIHIDWSGNVFKEIPVEHQAAVMAFCEEVARLSQAPITVTGLPAIQSVEPAPTTELSPTKDETGNCCCCCQRGEVFNRTYCCGCRTHNDGTCQCGYCKSPDPEGLCEDCVCCPCWDDFCCCCCQRGRVFRRTYCCDCRPHNNDEWFMEDDD